jgi:hypothetical protein
MNPLRSIGPAAYASAMENELSPRPGTPAGWYPDPSMSGTQRYWNGTGWTDHAAPITAPIGAARGISVSKGIMIVALGILAAVAAIAVIHNLSQPSDFDCAMQHSEVALGERAAWDVDEACGQ